MATGLDVFHELHRLLIHAENLRNEIERGPKTLKVHQDRLAKQEQEAKDYLEASRKLKVGMHEKEVSLKAKNQLIEKYEGQINAVHSKKEYDALKIEIANAKKECQKLEEGILELMSDVETRTARQPEVDREFQQARQKTAQLIDDVQARRGRITDDLAEVHKQLEAAETHLPLDMRATYEREKAARGADALAAVEDRTCKSCYTTITAQSYNELLSSRLVPCKNCGRILYLREKAKDTAE